MRADADLGVGVARAHQRVVPALHRALDQPGFDLGDGVDQPDVRGHVDDLHLGGGEHHGDLVDAHEVGQQFGVARVDVPGAVQRRLVQRRGADALHLALHAELAGDADVVVGGVAGLGGLLAPGQVLGEQVRVDHVDAPGVKTASGISAISTISTSAPSAWAPRRIRWVSPMTTGRQVS